MSEVKLPPLPDEYAGLALIDAGMQGSELRPLSQNYSPGCAMYSEVHMRRYALAATTTLQSQLEEVRGREAKLREALQAVWDEVGGYVPDTSKHVWRDAYTALNPKQAGEA